MFSKKSLAFLEDIQANNNRDWFLSQKKRYEEYKKEYHALIAAFLDAMKPHDSTLELLEVKNCTFRINRDIRFSKDKSPYKTHMGIWMNTNAGNSNGPGYYLHIEKGKSFAAGGFYSPENSELKKIRNEIAFFYDDLEALIADKKFKKFYKGLDTNNTLKTAPKDFDKEHPAIAFLKLKSFTVSTPIPDAELFDKDFVKKTSEKLLAIKPLNDFLSRGLSAE